MEAYLYGGLLRAAQSLLQSAPFLVCGLLVAGVYRRLLGHDNVRRLYGEGTWHSHIQAWAIGMILPIDSLGTIPIMREMRRAGLSGGTILAFGLTEPLFSPLSLLYGLTLSEPTAILAFAACSLVVVTGVGLLFDRIFPNTSQPEPSPPSAVPGIKRLGSVIFTGAREAAGGSAAFIGIGLIGVMLLSFALPPGSLQGSIGAENDFAPMLMAAVAVPAYATPMTAMSQLGMMFQHGNSVGAAFTLLVLGAGMTLGTLAWAWKAYGITRTAGLLVILLGITLGLSYGIERPLYPKDIEPADHTHAFDIYCRPYQVGAADVAGQAWRTLRENTQIHEKFGSLILGGYLLLGLVLRVADPTGGIERWTERDSRAVDDAPEAGAAHWTEMKVPPVTLGATVIVVLIAVSIVGCYAYYPSPDEVFEELRIAQGEALSGSLSGDLGHAEYWLPRYADWVRKLQVGAFLREGKLSEHRRLKAKLLLDRLELLEHELAHHDPAELRELIALIQRTHRRLREAYIATGEPPAPPSAAPAIAPLTVTKLVAKYRHFCEGYYRENDQPTTELRDIRDSLRVVRELCGLTPAAEFGPLTLRGRWINLDQPPALLAAGVPGMAAPKVFKTAVGSTLLPIGVTCKRPDGAVINRTGKPVKFYATDPDGNVVIEETENGIDVIDAVAGQCQFDFQSSHIPRCS